MICKRGALQKDKVSVTFEIPGTIWADRIHLVGDFNGWDRESLPFQRDREGNWRLELELDAGREYRFLYLVDGDHWRGEWQADKSVQNPQGGYDSIVIAQAVQELQESWA